MNKLRTFTKISAIVILIIIVLYVINLFFHGLKFKIPVYLFGMSHPMWTFDLLKLGSLVRRTIFAIFFGVLYYHNVPNSPIRKAGLLGFITSIISIVRNLQGWHVPAMENLFTWIFIIGMSIAVIMLSKVYKDTFFSVVAISYASLECASFLLFRVSYKVNMDLCMHIFTSTLNNIQVVLFALLEVGILYAFSRIKVEE